MIFELTQDFDDIVAAMPAQHPSRGVLVTLLRILKGESHRLMRFPWAAMQQIHNSLSPFCEDPLASVARDETRHFLRRRDAAWVELKRVLGPGRESWRRRFSVRTTEFSDRIEWFAVLPEGRMLALTSRFGTDGGQLWVAEVSGQPQPVGTRPPLTPSEGPDRPDRIAALDNVVAAIDSQRSLRFLKVSGDQVRFVGDAVANTAGVVAVRDGFIAALADGAIVRFSAAGRREAVTEGLGLVHPDALGISQDGKYTVLAKAFKDTSQLRVIDLERSRIVADRLVEHLIFRAAATSVRGIFLLGGMRGFFQWTEPWTDSPKRLATDSTSEITVSPDGRFWALVGGHVILNDSSTGMVSTVPVPGGELVTQQTAWSKDGGDTTLTLAGGGIIHTYCVSDLRWSRELSIQSIERAIFDQEGEHLIGVGAAGQQYLWNVATGQLLESHTSGNTYLPHGETYMPPIEWSPSHMRGAVCHTDEVEILDAHGELECSIGEPNEVPAIAAWDNAGKVLAYACSFGRDVRVVEFKENTRTCEMYSCEEPCYPRAVALSPTGSHLAFAEGAAVVAHNLATVSIKTSLTFSGMIEENVIVIVRHTGKRCCVLKGHPQHLAYLTFVSEGLLLVADMEGTNMILDVNGIGVVAQWWTPARLVGHCRRDGGILLADSGEGTNHAPAVYDIEIHLPQP